MSRSASVGVTIITPSFNNEREIGLTLSSLQKQTFQDWECLVIDDGSTDRTASVVREFQLQDSRFQLLQQVNSGPSVARNRGISLARGRYALFLDGDDWLGRHTLAAGVTELDRDLQIGAVFVRQFLFHDGGDCEQESPGPQQEGQLFPLLALGNRLGPGSVVWRTELFSKVGGFDPSVPGCEDWDYFVQLARLGTKFRFAAVDGFHYRKRRGSLSSRGKAMWNSGIAVLDRSFGEDMRVREPAPEFRYGLSRDHYRDARVQYAVVCAALAVAEGDAHTAIDLADQEILQFQEVTAGPFARQLGKIIWHAAVVPEGHWHEFWNYTGTALLQYLSHIEHSTGNRGFSGDVLCELLGQRRLHAILSSRSWRLIASLKRLFRKHRFVL